MRVCYYFITVIGIVSSPKTASSDIIIILLHSVNSGLYCTSEVLKTKHNKSSKNVQTGECILKIVCSAAVSFPCHNQHH